MVTGRLIGITVEREIKRAGEYWHATWQSNGVKKGHVEYLGVILFKF